MTKRENLLRALKGQGPDWIPIVGHCDPYNQPNREGMDPELAAALGEVQWGDESTVLYSRALGLDVADWFGGMTGTRVIRRNVTAESVTEGDVTTTVWHTPKGDLRETLQRTRDASGATSANRTEHLVKGPEDLSLLAAIIEDAVIERDEAGFEKASQRRQFIGDDGVVLGTMRGTPLSEMYRFYTDVATLSYLWVDARETLMDLFLLIEQNLLEKMAICVETDIDVIIGMDDTSTTAISPAMFEACNLELTDKRAQVAYAAGIPYFHHSCGHIKDLLPLYRRTQMDGVHAFTVPPTGNVTIAEGRNLLGDDITIFAGIEPLGQPISDRSVMRREVTALAREAADAGNMILGLTAFPDKTMDDTKFVLDCCREALGT